MSDAKIVLLVEDHEDSRVTLAALLRMSGWVVDEAADGVQALNMLLHRKPHIILTDLRMPNMDGIELAMHVQSSNAYRHIPIVMISATPPGKSVQYPKIAHLLTKPSSISEIAAALHMHCLKSSAVQMPFGGLASV